MTNKYKMNQKAQASHLNKSKIYWLKLMMTLKVSPIKK